MDAPDPRPPRTTTLVVLAGAVIGIGLVGLGLAIEHRVPIVVGSTVLVIALVLFVMTAPERARAALPVQHELVEIVASKLELREPSPIEPGPFEVRRSRPSRAPFVEVHYEDGTAAKREVVDAALRKQIRAGVFVLPCMGVAVCRGDELHGWHTIST